MSALAITATSLERHGPETSTSPTIAFRRLIRPGQTIDIPPLTCPMGGLSDHAFAPHAVVPPGVEIITAGGVGVTIGEQAFAPSTPGQSRRPIGTRGQATATNWDSRDHELIIKLHCVVTA